MNHPTKVLIEDTLRSGVRPFEAFAQVVEAMYAQARRDPPTLPTTTGRLVRAVAVEMGVRTYPLSIEEQDEVFHGAHSPNKDHGKAIETVAKEQFQKNLRDFRSRWSPEERKKKFTPKRYRKHAIRKERDGPQSGSPATPDGTPTTPPDGG